MKNKEAAYEVTNPQKIVAAILNRKWTQTQIAQRCGVAQSTVARIHSGKDKRPNFELVDKLRKLLSQLDEFDKLK